MAHRNRWFIYLLKNGGSFHGYMLNNQMVYKMVPSMFVDLCEKHLTRLLESSYIVLNLEKKQLSRLWGTSKSQLKSLKCLSSGNQSSGAVGPWPSNINNDNQVRGEWAVFKNLCRPLRLFGLWYFSICIMYIYIYNIYIDTYSFVV